MDPYKIRSASSPTAPSSISLPTASPVNPLLDSSTSSVRSANGLLPDYIRGLPPRLQKEDVDYLMTKGALTIPDITLRNELLKSYLHYVHPYMPILEMEEFLQIIAANDGVHCLSLLLFQAVMFAGTAFVDVKYLKAAGYRTRKAARKLFFQRTRLLYDFDYEVDRIVLVQSLLLMTHWYETPDDQKDTWHWMGVSLSLAHTIGLHRDPANSRMDARRQHLWKRIWWSTYCRDRLIALGMRRPMRVKDDDCDVPMLTMDDFEYRPFSREVVSIVGDSEICQNSDYQRQLSVMFINKSKLCLIISRVLTAQYSVLGHKFGGTMETTMMLVPKKSAAETIEVRRCDKNLEDWQSSLPKEAQYSPCASFRLSEAEEVLHSHRALLRMVFLTTSSALHRPQVLPAMPTPSMDAELQEMSRKKVRFAAVEITNIAQDLHTLGLTKYLPTTGVTVILPAVIIHLLDVKSSDVNVRMTSLRRFYQCMQILQRLREIYASADFATSFLEAAIRKAGIQISLPPQPDVTTEDPPPFAHRPFNPVTATAPTPAPAPTPTIRANALTPPPDPLAPKFPDLTYPKLFSTATAPSTVTPTDPLPNSFFASTPPRSENSESGSSNNINSDFYSFNDNIKPPSAFSIPDIDDPRMSLTEFIDLAKEAEVTQNDFDALINFDEAGADLFAADDGLGLDDAPGGSGGNTTTTTTDNAMPDVEDENVQNGSAGKDMGFSSSALTDALLPPTETGSADLDVELGTTLA